MNDDAYRAPAVCKNCGFQGYSDFPKGTPIEENQCPNCGCKTLRKPDGSELDKIQGGYGGLGDIFDSFFGGPKNPKKESDSKKQP